MQRSEVDKKRWGKESGSRQVDQLMEQQECLNTIPRTGPYNKELFAGNINNPKVENPYYSKLLLILK